jgi:hypothetical protein
MGHEHRAVHYVVHGPGIPQLDTALPDIETLQLQLKPWITTEIQNDALGPFHLGRRSSAYRLLFG